jgi:predicted nucleic acid-binding protein
VTGDVLFDTTVAVAHLRGVTPVRQRLAEAQVCYLPKVALGELHFRPRHHNPSKSHLST